MLSQFQGPFNPVCRKDACACIRQVVLEIERGLDIGSGDEDRPPTQLSRFHGVPFRVSVVTILHDAAGQRMAVRNSSIPNYGSVAQKPARARPGHRAIARVTSAIDRAKCGVGRHSSDGRTWRGTWVSGFKSQRQCLVDRQCLLVAWKIASWRCLPLCGH